MRDIKGVKCCMLWDNKRVKEGACRFLSNEERRIARGAGIFLNRLYHRGLEGKELKLVCIDENKGLYNALRFIYPVVNIHRCWVHKLKNVANRCPRGGTGGGNRRGEEDL